MGLAIKGRGTKTYPVIICDYCGKAIDKLEDGIISSQEHPKDTEVSPVHIYHRGSCDQREFYSDVLDEYIPWLLWNHDWGKKNRGRDGFTITMDVPKPVRLYRPPELLTITEAARRVGVSRETIYQWKKSGKIKAVKTPGGRYRIPEEQLTIPYVERAND
ncbi:excisionase family DNA-binding protein [Chloroflexota bacterium]